jgi:predicted component of type VI protein secretion system
MLCIPDGSKLLKTFNFEKLKELDFGAVEGEEMTPWIVHVLRLLPRSEISVVLYGLTSLSDAAAEALSKHEGELDLSGLESLSDSPGRVVLAAKLASQKGDLDLSGLESLSDAVAEALSKHRGELKFRNLTSLNDSPGHVALAEKLASQKDVLWLYGLKSLSDAAAEALSKHKGDLNLGSYKLTSQNDSLGYVALAR